jgi:SAM-dependent methyltransferase
MAPWRRLWRQAAAVLPRRRHASAAPAATGFIDVRQLIATLDDDELMASADAYFATMTVASEQCRKPFGNPADAVHQTRHLGLVLDAADLFRGARVLDFGCATGWLTLGLAQMGCDAVGVDISPKALKLAEALKARRAPARGGGTLDFLAYDGRRLPLEDASVDRVICFDAFHHVRDQGATLAEFARVLRPGGRAAFMEPGPNHSRTPQSQAEMARFKVIENDVDMVEVTRHAKAAGFEPPQMRVQFAQPFTVPVDTFIDWAQRGIGRAWAAQAIGTLERQLTNGQCFHLTKVDPDTAGRDSRRPEGLAARIVLESARRVAQGRGHGIVLRVTAHNTGEHHWLAAGSVGLVNLGVQLLAADGRVLDDNFARIRLPGGPIAPGEVVTLEGTVRMPGQDAFVLRLDMVSELVAWFSRLGRTSPLLVPSSALE